ncbi:hypothetical protein Tcan_17668 [Toxocara canis]|uniref:Uncharacterized protein n=1 Tax=Toxocara canis TaxID=6265 RepID=A0A0B2V0B9_TOXCA|nr:hypothetical protein Tcan_17668 [Toxocara canis]
MSDSDDHVDEMSTESPFGDAHISSHSCRETLLDKFETLANQLAGGWKYHVSNTDRIRKARLSFEDFYTNVCSFAGAHNASISASSESPQQLVADPQRERLALTHPYSRRISPYLCQKKLVEKVDALATFDISAAFAHDLINNDETCKTLSRQCAIVGEVYPRGNIVKYCGIVRCAFNRLRMVTEPRAAFYYDLVAASP